MHFVSEFSPSEALSTNAALFLTYLRCVCVHKVSFLSRPDVYQRSVEYPPCIRSASQAVDLLTEIAEAYS